MGAKLILDYRCVVKSALTLTGLIEALKQQGLLERVGELEAAGLLDGAGPGDRMGALLGDYAGSAGMLTVQEVAQRQQSLDQHRMTCRRCPASLRGYVGECIVNIPYPISEGMEFVLWRTAVQALEGQLPESVRPRVQTLAKRAGALTRTPFADDLFRRGDLRGAQPKAYRGGSLMRPVRLSSRQVLDAFFVNGLLSGDELQLRYEFLSAAVAVARSLEPAMADDPEQLAAMQEDVAPYRYGLTLLERARELGTGVYMWP